MPELSRFYFLSSVPDPAGGGVSEYLCRAGLISGVKPLTTVNKTSKGKKKKVSSSLILWCLEENFCSLNRTISFQISSFAPFISLMCHSQHIQGNNQTFAQ